MYHTQNMQINPYDWGLKWSIYSPDKIAFKAYEKGAIIRFAQLHQYSLQLANYLINKCQLQKGDRIAILAENSIEHLILFSVAQKTGCILVPINFRLATSEIQFLLHNSSPKILFYQDKFKDKIATPCEIPFQWKMKEMQDLYSVNSSESLPLPTVVIHPDDPIFILYTSGTTGFPKGALYTHKMLFWNSINTSLSLIVNSESRTINCMPLFHTGGWNVLLTPFFHHGGYTCLMSSFEPQQILKALQEEKVSIFMAVPTMLKMIADLDGFDSADLSSLHYIIVGGEPMPIPLIKKWHEKGVPIRQGFGMTEAGPNLTSLHQDDAIRKMGSIGRPNFYIETKIVDKHGANCPPNKAGELLLRSEVVSPGYWKNPEATANAFTQDWFHTGDRVIQDEDGYLFVIDRIKNMYISGGENVYPAEVERILLNHNNVSEAAVIGVPDEKWGESGKAFIVANDGISELELIQYCASNLAKFKVPKAIVFVKELPKNDTGKINRKALVQLVHK